MNHKIRTICLILMSISIFCTALTTMIYCQTSSSITPEKIKAPGAIASTSLINGVDSAAKWVSPETVPSWLSNMLWRNWV